MEHAHLCRFVFVEIVISNFVAPLSILPNYAPVCNRSNHSFISHLITYQLAIVINNKECPSLSFMYSGSNKRYRVSFVSRLVLAPSCYLATISSIQTSLPTNQVTIEVVFCF